MGSPAPWVPDREASGRRHPPGVLTTSDESTFQPVPLILSGLQSYQIKEKSTNVMIRKYSLLSSGPKPYH